MWIYLNAFNSNSLISLLKRSEVWALKLAHLIKSFQLSCLFLNFILFISLNSNLRLILPDIVETPFLNVWSWGGVPTPISNIAPICDLKWAVDDISSDPQL